MDGEIIAVIGTLLGTIVGAAATIWIQRMQLEHENRTRFHDQRLTVYADFNDACNRMMASISLGMAVEDEDSARFVKTFEMLRLIASRPVRDEAKAVHAAVGRAWRGEDTPVKGTFPDFNAGVKALCAAMRKETGVDENSQR